jgi:hypothetical protein
MRLLYHALFCPPHCYREAAFSHKTAQNSAPPTKASPHNTSRRQPLKIQLTLTTPPPDARTRLQKSTPHPTKSARADRTSDARFSVFVVTAHSTHARITCEAARRRPRRFARTSTPAAARQKTSHRGALSRTLSRDELRLAESSVPRPTLHDLRSSRRRSVTGTKRPFEVRCRIASAHSSFWLSVGFSPEFPAKPGRCRKDRSPSARRSGRGRWCSWSHSRLGRRARNPQG